MKIVRLLGIGMVFVIATMGWMVLGGITQSRKNEQSTKLRTSVQSLWGNRQTQASPSVTFHFQTEGLATRTETKNGADVKISEVVTEQHERPMPLSSTQIDVALDSDLRRKGLTWYSLYDVGFQGQWTYVHSAPERGEVELGLAFPDPHALYDDFRFIVDGVDRSASLDPNSGRLRVRVPVSQGQRIQIQAGYKSRGLDEWKYDPGEGIGRLESFSLRMRTDFADIDFPSETLSPSSKRRDGEGWILDWKFKQLVTGNGIGMVMPQMLQPGDLAAELAWSAPVSLFFFFFVIFVLSMLRNIDLHPINYLLLAGAFFAFHLLFAYSADRLPVEGAFALSSAVSVFLVVSYLRLVVSTRFAYVEAGIAQLVYLVGFSLAHFWEGYTGLTSTVLAIVTLYVMMQLTGRVRWSEVLSTSQSPATTIP